MIDFKFDVDGEGIERAIFAGDITTLSADVAALISLLYGVIKNHNDGAAMLFKKYITSIGKDQEIRDKIFSDELAKMLGVVESKKKKADKEEKSVEELLEKLISLLDDEDEEDD